MPNFVRVLAQLRSQRNRARQEIQRLEEAIDILEQLNGAGRRGRPARGQVSAVTRARMAAAQRARWARRKPRVMSAAARRKIAAAQRARWARQKGEPKKVA